MNHPINAIPVRKFLFCVHFPSSTLLPLIFSHAILFSTAPLAFYALFRYNFPHDHGSSRIPHRACRTTMTGKFF